MVVIDRIRIHGFRGIEHLQMPLSSTTVLLGANNCGKSTVLKALELALSDEMVVSMADFHEPEDGRAGDFLYVDVRFVPITGKKRRPYFSPAWQEEFKGHISRDAHGREFFAFRTAFNKQADGTTLKTRSELVQWEAGKAGAAIDALPQALQFVGIDAEEDIREAFLNENSFVSRMYEKLKETLAGNPELGDYPIQSLRKMLDGLSETLVGPGSKIPDSFVLTAQNIRALFSLVKHDAAEQAPVSALQGRGSLKSAAIMAILTLADLLVQGHRYRQKPLFLLLAAEEPETHLHPNAQRALMHEFSQLSEQLIVSTHSPYVASVCEPREFRSMIRTGANVRVQWLPQKLDAAENRSIKRLILRYRGEVLFARGVVFVEGVTEEQLIRGMFQAYFGDDPSAYGISLIGVDGKSYAPFMLTALSLKIPFCVISDNDGDARHVVLKQLVEMRRKVHVSENKKTQATCFLSPGLAIEGELVFKTQLHREIIDALMACSQSLNPSPKALKLQRERLEKATPKELKRRLEKKKAEYSGFLGEIILKNPYGQPIEARIPRAVLEAFETIAAGLGLEGVRNKAQ